MLELLRRTASLALISALLGSCGNSLWTVAKDEVASEGLDGAVLSYAMAQGEVTFNSEYLAAKGLTLSSDQKVNATADYDAMYRVVYNHNAFSNDDIDIQMEGALIKSLSSTTEDKSIAVVQGVTALLTQVSATQKDFEKSKSIAKFLEKDATPAAPKCTDMKSSYQKDLTNNRGRTTITQLGETSCKIRFNVTRTLHQDKILAVSGFMPQATT